MALGFTVPCHRAVANENPSVQRNIRVGSHFLSPFPAFAWAQAPAQNAPQTPASKGDDIPMPAGHGDALTRKLCSNCHSIAVWVNQRHTREKWNSILDNMVSKGMEASDDDLAVVNDYLATYLGPAAKDAPAKDTAAKEASPAR